MGWPALIAACAGALAISLGAFAATRGDEPPNLLLITLDTTRADHLGCYGHAQARTPTLDGLAQRGALFEDAHAHVPLTLPSHAVMLTGNLPSTLNLRVNGLTLRRGTATLATILKANGYWTGAVVASAILDRDRGLGEGFDVYDDRMTHSGKPGAPAEERPAQEVTAAALNVSQRLHRPYFLWIHYYDPHYPYRPPQPYTGDFEGRSYDGEIAYVDSAVAGLLDGLKQRGLLHDTVIAVAGDHGEGLMEHGEREHGVFLYEYALHVPLIIVFEGSIRSGLHVPQLRGLVDLAPTLLDLLRTKVPDHLDGESLRPLLEGRAMPPKPVYIESYHGFFSYGWAPLRGIVTERWKYIQAPKPELYEWHTSEMKNLFRPSAPEVSDAMAMLKRYAEADQAEKTIMETIPNDPASAETARRLMALGYLPESNVRTAEPGILDPKDAIGIQEELRRATDLLDMHQVQAGIVTLQSVLERNPHNVPALSMLGDVYLTGGQHGRAEECFVEVARLEPRMESAHLALGRLYQRTGRLDDAAKEYRTTLSISPRTSAAVASLAQVLLAQNRLPEAREVLESALARGVQDADVYFQTGILEATTKNWERARFAFAKTMALDPRRDDAAANLARVAYEQGRIDEAIADYERALRIAPRNGDYLVRLGSLYQREKGDRQRALGYYQRALALDPDGAAAAQLRQLIGQLQATGAE